MGVKLLTPKEHKYAHDPAYKYFKNINWESTPGVECPCWKIWLKYDFLYYTNYGWMVRKLFGCDDCLAAWWEDGRVNRDRKKLYNLRNR